MVKQHYRWDFIGLSTDSKPTPDTSEKVTDGSTFYCADNSKLYVYCKDNWYEKEDTSAYTLPTASADTLGGVKVGEGLSINSETGTLSADSYSLPIASADTLGGVKVGSGLSIDSETGTLSAQGGSSVNVVQTIGKSTTDVMSQDAVSGLLFYKGGGASAQYDTDKIKIGSYSGLVGNSCIVIGSGTSGNLFGSVHIGASTTTTNDGVVAVGAYSKASGTGSVAIGARSETTVRGQFDIGTTSTQYGYNSSNYRLLTGLYDPQSAHDGANKGYVDNAIINGGTTTPTTATVGSVGTLYSCVNSGTPELYMCTVADDVTPAYTWTKII